MALLLSLLAASKQQKGDGMKQLPANAATCPHHVHAPGTLDASSSHASAVAKPSSRPLIIAKKTQNEAFFRLPPAEGEQLECCKCARMFAMPEREWSHVDMSVFVLVNGGFAWPSLNRHVPARPGVPARIRGVVDAFLKPIANRAWPAPWTQHGFPRLKWREGPFVKKFGAPSEGAFTVLRAAGFVVNADEDAYLEMPDAASDERIAHVVAAIARFEHWIARLDEIVTTGAVPPPLSPLEDVYEIYRSILSFYSDLAKVPASSAAIFSPDEFVRGLRAKEATHAMLFFCSVMNGEEPLALAPTSEQKQLANKFSSALTGLMAEFYVLFGQHLVDEDRKKNPLPAIKPPAVAAGTTDLSPSKRARVGDFALTDDEQLLELAIAKSLESERKSAAAAGLGESDDVLSFSNDGGLPKGLTNTRQSCHANSLIQALFALKPLRRELLTAQRQLRVQEAPTDRKQRIATECLRELTLLFGRLDLSRARAVSARRFMEVLMRDSALMPGLQHDVTEVKDLMLSTLERVLPSLKATFYGTQLRLQQPTDDNNDAVAIVNELTAVWPPADDTDLDGDGADAAAAQSDDAARVQPTVAEKLTFSDVIVHLRRDECTDDLDDALARSVLGEFASRPHARPSEAILVPPPLLTVSVQRVEYSQSTHRANKIDTMMRFRRTLSLRRYTEPTAESPAHIAVIDRRIARLRTRLAVIERALNALEAGSTPLTSALGTVATFLAANRELSLGLLPPSLNANFGDQIAELHAHVAQQVASLRARADEIRVRIDLLTSERDAETASYALHAVLVHRGGANTGHYYAFVRANFSDDNTWFKCNDDRVESVDWKAVTEASFGGAGGKDSAYCLIYASPEYCAQSQALDDDSVLSLYDDEIVAQLSNPALHVSSAFQ
jgi:hypothetical protein